MANYGYGAGEQHNYGAGYGIRMPHLNSGWNSIHSSIDRGPRTQYSDPAPINMLTRAGAAAGRSTSGSIEAVEPSASEAGPVQTTSGLAGSGLESAELLLQQMYFPDRFDVGRSAPCGNGAVRFTASGPGPAQAISGLVGSTWLPPGFAPGFALGNTLNSNPTPGHPGLGSGGTWKPTPVLMADNERFITEAFNADPTLPK